MVPPKREFHFLRLVVEFDRGGRFHLLGHEFPFAPGDGRRRQFAGRAVGIEQHGFVSVSVERDGTDPGRIYCSEPLSNTS